MIDIFRVLPGGGTLLLYVDVVADRMWMLYVDAVADVAGSGLSGMPSAYVWEYLRAETIPVSTRPHLFAYVWA